MRLLLFLLLPAICFGQLELTGKTALKADQFIGKDSYGNTYATINNALVKTNQKERWNFADFTLGSITEVDIVNPLRILVYYSDFNIAVLLDNTLNEIERISFNEVDDYLNIETVRMANNNSVWVFNKDDQQLELYNYRSGNRSIISQPVKGNLLSATSDFNFCHLLTETEVISYNVYGSIIAQYANPGYVALWSSPKGVVALGVDGLLYLTSAPDKQLDLGEISPKIDIKDLQLTSEFLYIYDGEFVYSFRLTQD